MQELWKQLEETTNLFAYWDKELYLRHNFRDNFALNYDIRIENIEQIEFLYRSLYLVNRQDEFFTLLLPNLTKGLALNWLHQADLELNYRLLQFIPRYIAQYRPEAAELQFLVHIYKPQYNKYFIPIIDLLDTNECQFLISKTANPEFRKLLGARKTQIEEEKKHLLYNFNLNKNLTPLATIHGDKIDLIIATINYLHQNQLDLTYKTIREKKHFTDLLNMAQLLFEIGLVADSFQMLFLIYQHYEQDSKIIDFMDDEIVVKALNKEVRRVLPVYALLYQAQAFDFTNQIYSGHFPRLTPDMASLNYLRIYEKLAFTKGGFTSTLLDIYQDILKVQQERPVEIPLLYDKELSHKISSERFFAILKLAESKSLALPHEAFITLKFLQNILKHEFTTEVINKDALARNFLAFFHWLPSSLFINKTIISDLTTHTSPEIREQVEKILKLINYYEDHSIWQDLEERPDLIRNDDSRRLILMGKFMGVL